MTLSDQSRVWLYLSRREFSTDEVAELNDLITRFCRQWAAHGVNLLADGMVLHQRLIVLMVDETAAGASGCSIDSSVHFIRELESRFNTKLFDRLLVAVKDGEKYRVENSDSIRKMLAMGALSGDTLVINTVISNKKELDERLEIPLRDSWLSRYLKPQVH